MINRRGVIPIAVMLAIVLVASVVHFVADPGSTTSAPAATPTPTPTPLPAPDRDVAAALTAVQRAYDAGNARRLCRPGALVDPAVIRLQNSEGGSCESELETLMANQPRLPLSVRAVSLKEDLATATVTTAGGSTAQVDLVRQGRRWLLSFSVGDDPMPALAGTA